MCEASLWDAQADTIVPPGVQGLDRYAYVNNSPLNYVGPSGHFTCSKDKNSDDYCPGQSSTFTLISGGGNGKSKRSSHDENRVGGGIVSSFSQGSVCTVNSCSTDLPPNICPLSQTCWLSTSTVDGGPTTAMLHPLDGNIVYQEYIYDYNYFPRKPIGEIRIVYAKDGVYSIDWNKLGRWGAGEVASAFIKKVVVNHVQSTVGELAMLAAVCPECAIAYDIYQKASNIMAFNDAIIIESHLQVKNIIYYNNIIIQKFEQQIPLNPQPIK